VTENGISVCIVCRNEADKLGPCLDSVEWADEVIVMDLESDDDSVSVARERGAKVIPHERVPIVELVRNKVAAAAQGDWVLAMDPDERVSPLLAEELRRLSRRSDIEAVEIPFMHCDFGHRPSAELLRHDPKLRFYRRSRVRWPQSPNELPVVDPERLYVMPRRDDLVMVHERNQTIAQALERALRYAPAEAQAMIDAGEVFSAQKMMRRVAQKSRKQYVEGRAFDDGVPGIVRATVLVAFHFWVWAAFWQMSGAQRTPQDDRYLRRIGALIRAASSARRVARAPFRLARRVVR